MCAYVSTSICKKKKPTTSAKIACTKSVYRIEKVHKRLCNEDELSTIHTHKHTRFELEGSSSVDGWPIPAHHHHHHHHQNPSHADDRDDGGDAANNLRPFVINFYCSIQLVSKRGPQGLVVMPGERFAASAQHQRRWHDAGVKGTCARAREMCLLLSRAREKNGPNRPASECASDSPQVTLERAAALFVYWSKNGATSLLATLALLHCLRSVFFHQTIARLSLSSRRRAR